MKLFVSYARDDVLIAQGIVESLSARGIDVWWDERLGVGEAFRERIQEKLADCDFVVVIWTERSVHSKWVLSEALAARDSGRLISIALRAVIPPLGFRQFQFLKLLNADSSEFQQFAELVAGLDEMRPPQVLRERRGFLSVDFSRKYRLGVLRSAAWALAISVCCALVAAPALVTLGTSSISMVFGAFISLWLGRLMLPDPKGMGRAKQEYFFERHALIPFTLAIFVAVVWLIYITWARTVSVSIDGLARPNYLRIALILPITVCAIYIVPAVMIRILYGLGLFRTNEQVRSAAN